MKRIKQLLVCLLLATLLGGRTVHAESVSKYRDYIIQATLALEDENFPAALSLIKAAHFADPRQREPFYLLEQIPAFSNYHRSLRHYFDMGTEYYLRRDYRNARFFYAAAHHVNPSVPGVRQLLRHVDLVRRGQAAPLTDERSLRQYGDSLAVEAESVRVSAYRAERVTGRTYTVDHPPEVDEILAKYRNDSESLERERQRKIDAARQEVTRRPNDLSRLIKSQKLKQQAVRTLTTAAQPPARYRQTAYPQTGGRSIPVPPPAEVSAEAPVSSEPESAAARRRQIQAENRQDQRGRTGGRKEVIQTAATINLDEDLWQRQPGTILEIEFGESIVLEGDHVKRFLIIDPEVSSAERETTDRVRVTMNRRGTTIFHIWDERGRWTFNLKGVLPAAVTAISQQAGDAFERHATPFRISYSNNWGSFYQGDSPDNLDRQSLSFTQWVGIYGDTPYGFLDASANFFRFADSTENTGRTLGLSNANLGPFEDFSIRGWDASKRFSDLSLPGRFFRGVLFDSYALDRQVQFSYLKGQDRAVFLQTSQGVSETRKSYIEGARLVLFPEDELQFAFNYARGHGEERPRFLNDKVFSVEVKNRFGEVDTQLEVAYDESNFGTLLLTDYQQGDARLRVNLRDLQDGFTTISSRAADSGEVGGNIIFDYRPDNRQLTTNLDLYRDREQKNPDDPDNINIDLGTVYTQQLGRGYSWSNSFYFSHTPQLISPRLSIRWNTSLSKTFRIIFERDLSTYMTFSAQLSRFDKSPTSEYDRYGVGAGIRIPLIDRLSFFANYEQSYVEVKQPRERNEPNVMNLGVSYTRNFGSRLSGRASVTYRNEENTEGRFSFLAGSDTIRSSIGISYRPVPQVEVFVDGSLRNVLSESATQPAYHDADVRFGMRTDWETLFRWDPTATVRGTVYKDFNRNDIQDPGEPGVEGIVVRIGHDTVVTGPRGTYRGSVRAKKIKTGLEFDSVPQGYSLQSYLMKDIAVRQGETYVIDYGFVIRSGIYGVFFEDVNGNKQYDASEPTVAKALMRLDGSEVAASDFEGVYQFYDVAPGDHILAIDVNALPREFLPTIRLKNKITVQEGRTFTFHVPLKRSDK